MTPGSKYLAPSESFPSLVREVPLWGENSLRPKPEFSGLKQSQKGVFIKARYNKLYLRKQKCILLWRFSDPNMADSLKWEVAKTLILIDRV